MDLINIENRHFLAGINQNPNDLNVQKTGIQLISLYKFKMRKKKIEILLKQIRLHKTRAQQWALKRKIIFGSCIPYFGSC